MCLTTSPACHHCVLSCRTRPGGCLLAVQPTGAGFYLGSLPGGAQFVRLVIAANGRQLLPAPRPARKVAYMVAR